MFLFARHFSVAMMSKVGWVLRDNGRVYTRCHDGSLPQLGIKPPNNGLTRQVIDITVSFSDELLLETSGSGTDALPKLTLNNGDEAELVGGTGTREWLFSYTVPEDAAGSEVSVLDVAAGSPATVTCTGDCIAANWNGDVADLSVGMHARERVMHGCLLVLANGQCDVARRVYISVENVGRGNGFHVGIYVYSDKEINIYRQQCTHSACLSKRRKGGRRMYDTI